MSFPVLALVPERLQVPDEDLQDFAAPLFPLPDPCAETFKIPDLPHSTFSARLYNYNEAQMRKSAERLNRVKLSAMVLLPDRLHLSVCCLSFGFPPRDHEQEKADDLQYRNDDRSEECIVLESETQNC